MSYTAEEMAQLDRIAEKRVTLDAFIAAHPEFAAVIDRAPAADCSKRPAPHGWPFGELTDAQRHQNALLEAAARNGALRGLPSIFGELA